MSLPNYGVRLTGVQAGTAILLDGWKSVENEDSFDVITCQYIARVENDIPAKFQDVSTEFEWNKAFVVKREVVQEGDLYVGNLEIKGIKNIKAYKLRADSRSTLSRIFEQVTVGTTIFERPKDVVQYNPTVQILSIGTSAPTIAPGEVETPPIIPISPTVFATGTIKNAPFGWVVTNIRCEAVGTEEGDTSANLWLIDKTYEYIQEWADGYLV